VELGACSSSPAPSPCSCFRHQRRRHLHDRKEAKNPDTTPSEKEMVLTEVVPSLYVLGCIAYLRLLFEGDHRIPTSDTSTPCLTSPPALPPQGTSERWKMWQQRPKQGAPTFSPYAPVG
jgi:hypothetical protein